MASWNSILALTGNLKSGSVKDRDKAIDELSHIFSLRNRSSTIASDDLSDKNFHEIFEAIFQSVLREKPALYDKRKKEAASKSAASRLSKCAGLLRTVVAKGTSRFGRKTVLALIDHVTQTLPGPNGDLVPPLTHDYTKTLAEVLSHQPHVELLARKDGMAWVSSVDFLLDLVGRLLPDDLDAPGSLRASPVPGTRSTVRSSASTQTQNQRRLGQFEGGPLRDALEALHHLTSGVNAPLRRRSHELSQLSLNILKMRHYSMGPIQTLSFAIFNDVFSLIQSDDLTSALETAEEVVSLMTYWWRADKVSQDELIRSLRSEISRTMIFTYHYIENLALHSDLGLSKEIEDLCDTLWQEYSRRSEPFRLQLGDISLRSPSALPAGSLTLPHFSLRPHNEAGEGPWVLMQNLAHLEAFLLRTSPSGTDAEPQLENQPRKRRRIGHHESRVGRRLLSTDVAIRRGAIQLMSFMSAQPITGAEVMSDLDKIVAFAGDKDPITASWALLACASLIDDLSHLASGNDLCKQLWHVGARAISHPGTCRAACFLLTRMLGADILPYRAVSEDLTTIVTSADVNGPSLLCDSSISFMSLAFGIRNTHVPNASQSTCSHVIRWLFLRWNPAEPSFASFQAAHVMPQDFVNLILACCGSAPVQSAGYDRVVAGPLGETWQGQCEIWPFTEYLLLIKGDKDDQHDEGTVDRINPAELVPISDAVIIKASRKLVCELLHPKVDELSELARSWTLKASDGGRLISFDRFQSLLSACIVAALLLPQLADVPSSPSSTFETSILDILQVALGAAMASVEPETFSQTILRVVRPVLPDLETSSLERSCRYNLPLLALLSQVLGMIQDGPSQQNSNGTTDIMDIDDDFDSQTSKQSAKHAVALAPRRVSGLRTSALAFHIDTRMRLSIIRSICRDPSQAGILAEDIIDELLGLPDEDVLQCSMLLVDICRNDLTMSPESTLSIIERLGSIVSQPKYQCSEVALTTCIDVLEGLHHVWLQDTGQLGEMVGDLYNHFVKTCLGSNIFSIRVQKSMAQLLFTLLKADPDYGQRIGVDACRETLLHINETGPVAVKFFISERMAQVFEFSILMMHDQIFLEVLASLPTDPENISGIALRMLVLYKLACRWPTLLRRSTYHIFEIPANIPHSAPYATQCLKEMARTLHLDSPRSLFELFSRQLLFTWLESASLADIPFSIFGFTSLTHLVSSAQSDVIGLIVMRGGSITDAGLPDLLETDETQLLESNFSTALAYSMNFVAAQSSQQKDDVPEPGEIGIKDKIGNQGFYRAVQINFVDLVALFLDLIDQEENVEKVFSRNSHLKYASNIMSKIKGISHSSTVLPPNQQPMFRPKHVIYELSRLCQWTEFHFDDLWTPTNIVMITRKLLNTVHPALGSLHACSVVRKVRMLVALAGPVALESYPLEMLLNSTRDFLVDTECADDALGLSQYLLAEGSQYLAESPSFLAGYALSTLASLRVFLESSQASTTQESQFKATMGKAQKFHGWLSQYLVDYRSNAFQDAHQEAAFEAITQSAAQIRTSGNANKDTPEAMLLLSILADEGASARLLNNPSRRLALRLLCTDFSMPSHAFDDIIDGDDGAKNYANSLWKSCKAQPLSNNFLAWAGRAIGRFFAATGEIPAGVLQESELEKYVNQASTSTSSSEIGIVNLLQDLTADPDSKTAGLAEAALRTAVTQAFAQDDTALVDAMQRALREPLFASSRWSPFQPAPSDNHQNDVGAQHASAVWREPITSARWVSVISTHMIDTLKEESLILAAIVPTLFKVKGFAEKSFPFVVHLLLLSELKGQQSLKRRLSEALKGWLGAAQSEAKQNIRLLLNTLLYLRTQPYPNESSIADRLHWLDVDYNVAAAAAAQTGMYKTSLLFAELVNTESSRTSRRSSVKKISDIDETLLTAFEHIDDPDAYYGVPQEASLATVLARVEHEKHGTKSLAFRGAQYDSHLRLRKSEAAHDGQALAGALGSLGLSGLSHSLLQAQHDQGTATQSFENTFRTARKLEVWNLPAPALSDDSSVVLYKVFQSLNQVQDIKSMQVALYAALAHTTKGLVEREFAASSVRSRLASLASLTELSDVLSIGNTTEAEDIMNSFDRHSQWMKRGEYDDVSQVLSNRGTIMSMASQHAPRLRFPKVALGTLKRMEVQSLLISSNIYRYHEAKQESLNIATILTDLIPACESLGIKIDAAVNVEAANALWDFGEISTSIRILQSINQDTSLSTQTLPVHRSDLLSKLGHQVSVARLEKPQDIQKKYLQEALKDIKGRERSKEAGLVFHQFAVFCDEQLQDPAGLEDLERLQNLKKGKSDEVAELGRLISSTRDTQVKNRYKHTLTKEEQWLKLDSKELQRVELARAEFVRLSLENYLLSLIASDDHNNDALRFTALWLSRSAEDTTNNAVAKHLSEVPTRKFASLMNQLTSRLQNQDTPFQRLIMELVYNICVDHPYHGMYQIWSGTKAKAQQRDDIASLRVKATERVAQRIAGNKSVAGIWLAIDKTSRYYHGLAMDKNTSKYKSGAKVPIKESQAGLYLANGLARYKIPPPTMQIDLSATKDYSQVPTITKLEPTMSIASGVSAPKIITAVASDGSRYRQLVKGGHDDLRQDAIMEQVFAAVSSLLKGHRATQQRNLGIRTYKVLPLTASSGLIEFVPNTIPLHEFLMPAHERYYPRDYKGSQCRKEIFAVQNRSNEHRLATFRKVTDRFHPVMKYFFMEYFVDPDEWFARRLAYTRSTAAISMLGHVLGLGDRHGHNILLDTKTGEAVHIDLGVAFEAGRILPVPELVPFRLTRDIVDGMGITKTEGVFRRCCEFTLDALREEQYSIMTILDVLRYDPLYNWTISPLRLAKLQKARNEDESIVDAMDPSEAEVKGKKTRENTNEPSEADRALEIVQKKLSKTLSVTATVNDLINQAMDEQNLAVLYSGWAAYA